MLDEGLIIVKRDQSMSIIPSKRHIEKISKEQICIRYGQLNSENKIDGLGRKITVVPKFSGLAIIEIDEENTFIEEGEFI